MLQRSLGFLLAALLVSTAGCTPRFATTEADLARGSFARGAAGPVDSLVVASYNIQYGERIDQAIRDLRSEPHLSRADILLLQEMDPEGCERIARALGYDFAYYPAAISPHHHRLFGNAVLVRGRILRTGFVELPLPGGIAGTSRIAVTAEVEFGGRTLHVVSLHQSTKILPLADRLEQVRAVLEPGAGWTGPAIIGGDFNTAGVLDTLMTGRLMRESGFREGDRAGTATIHPGWRARLVNCRRLDHIYARGLAVRRVGVAAGARASDHFPIWAVYGWGADARDRAR